MPNVAAFTAAIDDEQAGRPSWDDRVTAATERFLEGEELPAASNPEVVALIDTEAADTELYGRHLRALAETFDRQANAYARLSALSPTVAMHVGSMALAGTDLAHYHHFAAAAAQYRTRVVEALNSDLAAFDSWKTFSAAGNRESWARVPEFDYDTPPVSWALQHLTGAAVGGLAWLLLAALLLFSALRHEEVHG
jgi:ABC-2 type transport system permease protein